MELSLRPMTAEDRLYAYAQSAQISSQTGYIGRLRGDMDGDGEAFLTSWDDYNPSLKTDAFKKEFDKLINTLRTDEAYGPLLQSRRSLARYGFAHPESSFTSDYFTDYGFRANTKDYSCFLRVNGRIDDYNVYCYCHYRPWLEQHMEKARSGIRFITPAYEDLFRIPDGGKIRITWKSGDTRDLVCRYVDDYHFETSSGNLYHICEFAERAALHGSRVEPLSPVIRENSSMPKKLDRGDER